MKRIGRTYRLDTPNGKSMELAEKITTLVIDSAVTYQEAADALEAAQDMLAEKTRPVRNRS